MTTNKILEFLQEHGATKADIKILKGEMDEKFDEVNSRFDEVNSRFEGVNSRLDRIESQMVTKEYLDDKLADLRGDLVILTRKEDAKLIELVKILGNKQVLAEDEVKKILEMEPFPKLSL